MDVVQVYVDGSWIQDNKGCRGGSSVYFLNPEYQKWNQVQYFNQDVFGTCNSLRCEMLAALLALSQVVLHMKCKTILIKQDCLGSIQTLSRIKCQQHFLSTKCKDPLLLWWWILSHLIPSIQFEHVPSHSVAPHDLYTPCREQNGTQLVGTSKIRTVDKSLPVRSRSYDDYRGNNEADKMAKLACKMALDPIARRNMNERNTLIKECDMFQHIDDQLFQIVKNSYLQVTYCSSIQSWIDLVCALKIEFLLRDLHLNPSNVKITSPLLKQCSRFPLVMYRLISCQSTTRPLFEHLDQEEDEFDYQEKNRKDPSSIPFQSLSVC